MHSTALSQMLIIGQTDGWNEVPSGKIGPKNRPVEWYMLLKVWSCDHRLSESYKLFFSKSNVIVAIYRKNEAIKFFKVMHLKHIFRDYILRENLVRLCFN